MDPKKQVVSFKEIMKPEQAVSYLRDLIRSLEAGSVTVRQGDTAMTLQARGYVELEVKAVIKKGKHKLDLELEWIPSSMEGGPTLSISPEADGETQDGEEPDA